MLILADLFIDMDKMNFKDYLDALICLDYLIVHADLSVDKKKKLIEINTIVEHEFYIKYIKG
jgi:hypothetical protein